MSMKLQIMNSNAINPPITNECTFDYFVGTESLDQLNLYHWKVLKLFWRSLENFGIKEVRNWIGLFFVSITLVLLTNDTFTNRLANGYDGVISFT